MHTEAEARGKWCPFARYVAYAGEAAWNRYMDSGEQRILNPAPACCIASDCAAWRWEYPTNDPEARYTDEARGFCGLAGRP